MVAPHTEDGLAAAPPDAMTEPRCDLSAVLHQGYAVWHRTPEQAHIHTLRDAVDSIVQSLGATELWSKESRNINEFAALTATGLALPRLLAKRPDLLPLALPPALREGVASVLGRDARVELVGAVVTDRSRPYFTWHTHIDGLDESVRSRAGSWPNVPRLRRILTLLYLDDIDDDYGPLLVLPRKEGDPCEPHGALDAPEWPGQIVLQPQAGTLVALDECTWHAARAMTRDGRRRFVGVYFAAADTAVPPWTDPSLDPMELV